MDSVYFAFGAIAVVLIIHWAMMAERGGGPHAGLLAMRRYRPDDPKRSKAVTANRRRAGALRR
jgi:hypothetical protein